VLPGNAILATAAKKNADKPKPDRTRPVMVPRYTKNHCFSVTYRCTEHGTKTNRGVREALGRSVHSNGKACISSKAGHESARNKNDNVHERCYSSSTIIVDALYAKISYKEAGKGTDKWNAGTL
jgi:hypothetical protein